MSHVPIDLIDRNEDQPRQIFDPSLLEELADSIQSEGLLQPITIRPMPDGRVEVVAGERRWRAHKILANDRRIGEFSTISCNIVEMTDLQRDVAAIVENLQRAGITPLEESDAIFKLLCKGMTPTEIGQRLGLSDLKVKWRLSLQNLAPEIRHLFATGNIEQQSANEIARLPDHREQMKMLKLIQSGRLVGWKAVRGAVEAIVMKKTQQDIFGESLPTVTEEDVAVLSDMEKRVERIGALVSSAWKDGACLIAVKVSRDRARLVAEKLAAIQPALRVMERELRNVSAQADAVLVAAE